MLWAVFLAIRLLSLILAPQVGARLVESTGAVLISFGTNRLVASLVVRRRAGRALATWSKGVVGDHAA